MSTTKTRPTREEIGSDENLCESCTAKCCRYFALPIETPTTRQDYDFIRWYLLHQGAAVFTDEEDWYLLVHSDCKHLGPENMCGIYETRPQICRDYATKNCEYEDTWTYERYFETPEQVEEYAEAVLMPRPKTSIRSRKIKPKLPVLA